MLLFDLFIQYQINKTHLKLTKSQIKHLQHSKFTQLVQYIAIKSPYYKDIIQKNKINPESCYPEDFPILTKTDVIEHFDRIVTDTNITKEKTSIFLEKSTDSNDLFLDKYYVIHTSGSSGTIGYYIYSQQDFLRSISNFSRAGVYFRQKFAYVAAAKGHFAGITLANFGKRLPLFYKEIHAFDINQPFKEIITRLNRIQPDTIGGYAFALRKLAEAQKEGNLHIHPRVLESGGEPLHVPDKEYIKSIFNVPLVNVYASGEHLLMGIGRDDFGGMYLMEDNLIFEIEKTYTLVTNLFNYTLPLIRYQMSDHLQPIADTKHIFPFTKVADIVGRDEYVPMFLNQNGEEDFISPLLIAGFYVNNLTQFQLQIINKERFIFRASLEPHLTQKETQETVEKIEKKLKALLAEKLMTNVQFSIELVDHLWADPKTRKFRLIVKPIC